MRRGFVVALMTAAALMVSACGDDDVETSATTAGSISGESTTTEAARTTTTSNPCPPEAAACDTRPADVDHDGAPDDVVLFGTDADGEKPGQAILRVVWGDGAPPTDVTAAREWNPEPFVILSLLGAADMNGDDLAEIIAITEGGAHARFGTWWTSTADRRLLPVGAGDIYLDGAVSTSAGIACRDVDGDGRSDIVQSSAIFAESSSASSSASAGETTYDIDETVYRWRGNALEELSQRSYRQQGIPDDAVGVHCPGFDVYPEG